MMEGSRPQHVADRASLYAKTQLEHLRFWLVQCGGHLGAMLSTKDGPAKSQSSDHESPDLVSNFESLLFEFQSLLIWENPCSSAIALTVFTFLYWITVLISPRLFSIIAVIFFCYHFYEMWTRYVWPEIRVPPTEIKENWTSVSPNVLSAPEIQSYLAKLKKLLVALLYEVADLRHRSHGTFCFLSISSLAVICILGRIIPGVVLVYGFAILFFLTPGFLLHVLPPHVLETLLECCSDLSSQQSSQHGESCALNDLDLTSESAKDEVAADHEESSTPSPLKSQFYEHFFASDRAKSASSSTSDILGDFEIISETDLSEMYHK